MSSERPWRAFVWVWLPGASEPVVAGRLDEEGGETSFVYGRSYLARPDAISLYTPELPLVQERIRPLPDLDVPGCILDACPDAWGQRVIMNRLIGADAARTDPAEVGLLTFLLESGSDRIGALDFQSSPDDYVPRGRETATLEEARDIRAAGRGGDSPLPGARRGAAARKLGRRRTAEGPDRRRGSPADREALLEHRHVRGRPGRVRRDGTRSSRRTARRDRAAHACARQDSAARRALRSSAGIRRTARDRLRADDPWAERAGGVLGRLRRASPRSFAHGSRSPPPRCASCSRASRSTSLSVTPTITPAITRRSGTGRRSP